MSDKEILSRQIKNLIINPRVQFKLIAVFAGVYLLTEASLYSTIYLFFWRFQEKAINVGIPEGHVFFKFLGDQKYSLDMLFMALAVINFFILILVGIIISHRIAGPIEKLKIHLDTLHGEADDFKLRDSDFFSDISPVVNKLREKFKL